MQKTHKNLALVVLASLLMAACGPAPTPPPTPTTAPAAPVAASTEVVSSSADPHHSDVDLTRLPLGDLKVSTSPQRGQLWSCMAQFDGAGARGQGDWLNGDGTWDLTRKPTVDGEVQWPHEFTITLDGDRRVFQSNDLPDHITGVFPIAGSDDAYEVDQNPNSIQSQTVRIELPANPRPAAQPSCVGGEVGILLSGVIIFNAFDAVGRDAAANEVQDNCQGHPQNAGLYHYHSLSSCLDDTEAGHSALMGYAFDGFGIYGYYGEDGGEVTNADLDECHGHAHTIDWDGQSIEMYHYHATHEFPYSVGCFHGTSSVQGPIGGPGGQQPGQQPEQPQQGGGQGGQPPQEAIDACVGRTANASCTINAPNGAVAGTCQVPPQSTQLVCVPAGGPP